MNNLNQQLNMHNSLNANIRVSDNDNSIIVEGRGPKGHISMSFLKSDPDLKTKVLNKVDELKTYQRNELQEFVNNAIGNFDDKILEVETQTADFIDQL